MNVVDLMRLQPSSEHAHGMPDAEYDALFTTDKPVVFAYHGYPWLIHRLAYKRHGHDHLHVRGYKEKGTTTTPFDMVMLNDMGPLPPRHGRDRSCTGAWLTRGQSARADGRRAIAPSRVHAGSRCRHAGRERLDLAGCLRRRTQPPRGTHG